MKVAILTIHHVANYGAVMQAYSLRMAVKRLGHECDVINYQPKIAVEFYRKSRGRFPKSLLQMIRHRRIQRFVDRFVIVGKKPVLGSAKAVFDEATKYDAVICGSDQIWNASGFRGLDESFFMAADLPSTKKISYAPSIGSSDPGAYTSTWKYCGEWLQDFDAISVRDLPSQRMVESFGLTAPKLVCDPTLLPSAMEDLLPDTNTERDVLLIYGGRLNQYGSKIRTLADANGLKIVSVGARCSFADKTYFFADPGEWAVLFSKARVVVTGMFHGVQLALVNDAVPLFIGPAEKKSKVMDVLTRYGIEQQWIGEPGDLTADRLNDGFETTKRVGQLRDEIANDSLSWLESQLS